MEKKTVLGTGAKCCGENCGACAPAPSLDVTVVPDDLFAELLTDDDVKEEKKK